MCVMGVEGSEKKSGPPLRIISGTAPSFLFLYKVRGPAWPMRMRSGGSVLRRLEQCTYVVLERVVESAV